MKTEIKTPMKSSSVTSYGGGGGGNSGVAVERTIDHSIEGRVAALEARPVMPAAGSGALDEVLKLDSGLRPRWGTGGSGLPSMTGSDKYMVLQITDDSPYTADWDWVRSHE